MDDIFSQMTPENQQLMYLDAAIGAATQTTGSIDIRLIQILVELLAPAGPIPTTKIRVEGGVILDVPLTQPEDFELASIILFSHVSVDARFEVVRDIMKYKFKDYLEAKPNDGRDHYRHRVATFLIDCYNKTERNMKDGKWMRNLAAHGSKTRRADGSQLPTLVPHIFDFKRMSTIYKKTGRNFHNGFTADELMKFIAESNQNVFMIEKIAWAVKEFRRPGKSGKQLQERLAELAMGLKLKAPQPDRTKPASPGP